MKEEDRGRTWKNVDESLNLKGVSMSFYVAKSPPELYKIFNIICYQTKVSLVQFMSFRVRHTELPFGN